MKNIVFENAYQKNARTLLDKLNSAEAILVGAAAGMSASCGYNFSIRMMRYFRNIWGISIKNMDLPEPLTDFTIIILPRKLTGHFLYVWAIWNMSVLQDSLTTISWNSLRVKTIIL